MPTPLQTKLANAIVDNIQKEDPLNGAELLESVGYADTTSTYPGRIIGQKGVQEALKGLGFDTDNAKRVVGEILDNDALEPKDRLKAAEQVFKVMGAYAPEKTVNLNYEAEVEETVLQALTYLNEFHKGTSVQSDGVESSSMGTEVQS